MGVSVLRLSGGQVESLFDLGLPVCVAELPADLAALDGLLAAPGVLAPIEASWAAEAVGFGRPTVPMDRFVRLMVVKARCLAGARPGPIAAGLNVAQAAGHPEPST